MKWMQMSPLQNIKWTLSNHILKTVFAEGFGGLVFILEVSNNCLVTPKLSELNVAAWPFLAHDKPVAIVYIYKTIMTAEILIPV